MLMNLYVIRDCLAEESSCPVMAKNDGVASVMFSRQLKDVPFDTAGSYKLLHVGMMDTESTVITITPVREVPVDIAIRDPKVPDLVDDLMGMKEGN